MVSRSHSKSDGAIARRIGRSKSTVSREIKRNSLPAGTKRGVRSALHHRDKRRHAAGGPEERRGAVPGMRSISERPREAEARTRLVTLVDRASGLLEGGGAESLTKTAIANIEIAAPSRQPAVETVTPDRGRNSPSSDGGDLLPRADAPPLTA